MTGLTPTRSFSPAWRQIPRGGNTACPVLCMTEKFPAPGKACTKGISATTAGGYPMAKKETSSQAAPMLPMLKTVEQMSKVSGIGENKLRELMDSGELEYIQNGNRRLIADSAIWDWYHRAKTTAKSQATQGG